MEEIDFYLEEAQESMHKALQHLGGELLKIRAGKAMPNMLDSVRIEYYGNMTPLSQVSSITTPDARSLMIKPFEKNIIGEIERAITNSDLGLNPQSDGEVVRINIPMLTEERRKDLARMARAETETGKIGVRNIRKETNDLIKQLLKENVSEDDVKHGEERVQKLTNEFIAKMDELLAKKEVDIMHI